MPKALKKVSKTTATKNLETTATATFIEKANLYLQKHAWRVFWILFGITVLISTLLYDPRVSPSGDDSGYILRAYNFYKQFTFPAYQGPLYPIVLSLITAVFGLLLLPLKLFSMASILAFIYITFISFRNRIPYLLLFSILFLTSINAHILFYASQTYSEAFYMFMQSLVLLVFFRYFIDNKKQISTLKFDGKRHALLALVMLGAVLTRTVGFSLFIGVVVYFIVYREWKNVGLSVLFFASFYVGYEVIKFLLWGNDIQFGAQSSQLFNKDFYNPQQGKESVAGLFSRFIRNSNLYLSKHFYIILGLRERVSATNLAISTIPFVTIFTYTLSAIGLYLSYRKNRYVFFSGLIAGAFLVVTFFSLQTIWDQNRLIIPVIFLILLLLLYTIYCLVEVKIGRYFQFLFFISIIILSFVTLVDTSKQIRETRKLKDAFSELTPDWINYLKVSVWAEENLPKESLVACRKPDISSIYAKGKKFYGITNVPGGNIDLFLKNWENNPDAYVAIPTGAFDNKPYIADFNDSLAKHQQAILYADNKPYFVFRNFETLHQHAGSMQLSPLNNNDIAALVKQPQANASIFYPDSLLYKLKKADVTHIITANLRGNPYVKNGSIINTVERYISFIQIKYPSILQLVVGFGDENNEPAQLYKINWSEYQQ